MAVDRKSDHYTSAKGYTDLDGQSRQFTFIDHDKKTKISGFTKSDSDFSPKDYRNQVLKRITDIPASLCPQPFNSFVIVGQKDSIEWNVDMLIDAGVSIDRLSDLVRLLENKAEEIGFNPAS